MRRLAWLLCLLTASVAGHAGEAPRFVERSLQRHGVNYRYQVFVPDGWTAKRDWPVVLFLHGSGERGSDNRAQLSQCGRPWLAQHGADFPAVVVIPQAPDDAAWHGEIEQMALQALDDSIGEWHGDRRRLYLTGLSMGGYGVWDALARKPELFAAAVSVCGGGDIETAERIKEIPVWLFHGDQDGAVPVSRSRDMVAALRKAGAHPKYTEYPGVGHNSWDAAYKDADMHAWLFAQKRK